MSIVVSASGTAADIPVLPPINNPNNTSIAAALPFQRWASNDPRATEVIDIDADPAFGLRAIRGLRVFRAPVAGAWLLGANLGVRLKEDNAGGQSRVVIFKRSAAGIVRLAQESTLQDAGGAGRTCNEAVVTLAELAEGDQVFVAVSANRQLECYAQAENAFFASLQTAAALVPIV
jgi:hypothetical protein